MFQGFGIRRIKTGGIVSSYRANKNYVFESSGTAISYYVRENTVIIHACSIEQVSLII